jgi:hypothetical protein
MTGQESSNRGDDAGQNALVSRLLDDIAAYPRQHRMPSALLVGEPGSARLATLEAFIAQVRKPTLIQTYYRGGAGVSPIIPVATKRTEAAFYESMLDVLAPGMPQPRWASDKLFEVLGLVRDSRTHIIVFDDFDNMFVGSKREQERFGIILKYLSNKCEASIVGTGTTLSHQAMLRQPELASRFTAYRVT